MTKPARAGALVFCFALPTNSADASSLGRDGARVASLTVAQLILEFLRTGFLAERRVIQHMLMKIRAMDGRNLQFSEFIAATVCYVTAEPENPFKAVLPFLGASSLD
jgi:hypothetical protein